MRVVALIVVAGCTFQHGAASMQTDDASGGETDAPRMIDARPIDARPIDAACPDDDTDGVCNDVDDWPCGAKPQTPAAMVSFVNNGGQTTTTVTMTDLNNTVRLAVGPPSTSLPLTMHLRITDTACSIACRDQLELGWVTSQDVGNRGGCAFDATVDKQDGVDSDLSGTMRTPATTGVYDLRVNLGQNSGCGTGNWWPNGTPPAAGRTIAKVCVH